ncbi:allograft inflammatory factor 1-like [Mixophyes fleayi]|uniref:allograft inflammatory factor 1-like n=1 Tax=Mixophyes fleayi TaxID=3061075 RepID=UPI003F4D8CB5
MDLGEKLVKRETLEKDIDHTNKEYIEDEPFQDIANLAAKLDKLKSVFMKYDHTSVGEIDYYAFHALARDLGIITTSAELRKRVHEITGNTRNVIPYKDCAMAMLGRRSTMCQRIMRYNIKERDFQKRSCWLERITPSYVSNLEFAVHSCHHFEMSLLPPLPPPSPADMRAGKTTKTYSAA